MQVIFVITVDSFRDHLIEKFSYIIEGYQCTKLPEKEFSIYDHYFVQFFIIENSQILRGDYKMQVSFFPIFFKTMRGAQYFSIYIIK